MRALGIAVVALVTLGCGSGKGAGSVAQYYGDYHPTGWISAHGGQALAGVDACTKCHELSIIKVGSGVPTCLTTGCHHQSTPGWAGAATHGMRAKLAIQADGGSLVSCQLCHGKDFSGGPSASACASCHGVQAPHPAKPWRLSGGSVYTHATTDPANAAVCAQCHYPGSPKNPAGHPITPAAAGTQPGCYNATLCHGANTAPHPVPFLKGQTDTQQNGHLTVTAAAFAGDCATCHATSGTSPLAAAPLCNVCHTVGNPVASGTGAGTCLSCHTGTPGLPNGPSGSGFPSLSGAHAKHMALATQLTCDTCHAGAGAGTVTHYTNANVRIGTPTGPAPVVIDQIFTPKSGTSPTFSPAALTCSNVSCHGAQTTPGWQNGTLNTATQCTACHGVAATAGTAVQANDAFGRHSLGTHNATVAANGIACTTCHAMSNGSLGALAHFKYLNTSAVDGVATGIPADQLPSGTIVFDPLIVTGAGTYTVTSATQGNGGCAILCHTHAHTTAFDTWTATGAPHPVPFLGGQTDTQGNGHLTVTPAAFASDCATCHAYSGTSPIAGAPLCATCHTLANPTSAGTGVGTCLSCHAGPSGLPAGPTGTTFPNIAGAHAKHMALLTPLSCDACHAGSGAGTTPHYTNANALIAPLSGPATVSLSATYNAQSGGSAGFNPSALTCSSTSCHGGQVSPNWRTGSIASASQCLLCHAVNSGATASQYNDAIGRHARGTHSNASTLDCTICHDMTTANTNGGAVNHFKYLNTTAVSGVGTGIPADQLPSGTIKFKLTNATYAITGAATYTINATTPEGDGGCALSCHGQTHDAITNHWGAPKGTGVAHPVPFLSTDTSNAGNHHQTVTQAQFTAECSTCHDLSGATTKTGPVCAVCHTLASPVATGTAAGTCLSCHVGASFRTMGPTGSTWPNIQGAHPKHLNLSTFTRSTPGLPASLAGASLPACAACHAGSLPGDATNTHYSNANLRITPLPAAPGTVAIDPTFNAQSGAAGTVSSASAFTCSNISCHGGQTTPGWQTGSITVNATTYCIACHKVTSTATQYNDATGRHNNPGAHNTTCDYCHDMTQAKTGAQNHFKYLDTTAVRLSPDQLSSDTVKFGGGATPATGALTYTVNATIGRGGCALSCHGQTHSTTNNVWN